MKAKVLIPFKDKKEGVVRKKGGTFILSKERFKELSESIYGALVAEVAEETMQKGGAKKS